MAASRVSIGASAVGQGVETVYAQIAADALEVPFDRISGVQHGSTDDCARRVWLVPLARRRHGRVGDPAGGGKPEDAPCARRRPARLGAAAAEVTLADGVALAAMANRWPGASWRVSAVEESFANTKHTYSLWRARRACRGRRPDRPCRTRRLCRGRGCRAHHQSADAASGQMIGAIVQGLGGALLEHLVYDREGQLLTGSLADYLLPTASDFPQIRAMPMEEYPVADQPAGRQGRRRGRHRSGRRRHRQRRRRRARLIRRRAARAAAVADAGLAIDPSRVDPGQTSTKDDSFPGPEDVRNNRRNTIASVRGTLLAKIQLRRGPDREGERRRPRRSLHGPLFISAPPVL